MIRDFAKFSFGLKNRYGLVWLAATVLAEGSLAAEPAGKLPVIKPSDLTLHCVVNLDGHAIHYPATRWANVHLITDFSVFLDSAAQPQRIYEELLSRAYAVNPDIVIGRYLSGARVEPKIKQYPPEAIKTDSLLPALLRPGTNRVDIHDPKALGRFTELVLDEHRRFPRPVLFLDNIVHPSALPGWIPWQDTCEFLAGLRKELNSRGTLLIVNIAVASWGMSDADIDLLTEAVDGMSFEIPFHPLARQSKESIARQVEVYRRWLRAGKVIVLIAVPDKSISKAEEKEREVETIATLAMMVREPGDRIFVAWPFYKQTPEWAVWPAKLGPPTSAPRVEDPLRLSRTFRNGSIQLDLSAKKIELQLSK